MKKASKACQRLDFLTNKFYICMLSICPNNVIARIAITALKMTMLQLGDNE